MLYNSILDHGGAVVSEYSLGMEPSKGSFPSRNRIIAGLSQAVLVTEGAEDSGSLITANDAFANNRRVFAVPGPITSSLSRGPLSLIGKGAKLVTSAGEILEDLRIGAKAQRRKGVRQVTGDTPEEQKILDLLRDEAVHFDELMRKTGAASAVLGSRLSLLEMKGQVRNLGNGLFGLEDM